MRATRACTAIGFTLIELMIVVAVITILGSIAYPSYMSYATRAKRSDAQQVMQESALKEGQYILDARGYTGTLGSAGLNINRSGWTCTTSCTSPNYTISVAADNSTTPPSYTISAAPVSGSGQANDGTLTLTNTGARQRLVSSVDKGW